MFSKRNDNDNIDDIISGDNTNIKGNIDFEDLSNMTEEESEESQSMSDMFNLYDDGEDEDIAKVVKDAKQINSMKQVNITNVGYSDEYEDSQAIEDDYLQSIEEAKREEEMSDLYGDKNSKKGKKNKRNKRRRKEKDPGFFNIDGAKGNDLVGEDFVIIGEKKRKFKSAGSFFKLIITAIIFIILTATVYVCLSFKFVPENIKGSIYNYNGMSIISSSYKPNLDELRQDDKIIVVDKESVFPLVMNYKIYTCQSRNGYILFTVDQNGMKKKIEVNSVNYIIRNN